MWVIDNEHNSERNAMESLLRLCLDERNEVHTVSVTAVQSLQKQANKSVLSKLISVLWKTQFSGSSGDSTVSRTYDFHDNMAFSERLGSTLLPTILQNIAQDHLPLIALAANHPRLCPYTPKGNNSLWYPSSGL